MAQNTSSNAKNSVFLSCILQRFMLTYHTLKTKETWYKMKTGSSIQIDSSVLQLYFLDLLYKEDLINKETYYAARVMLRSECEKD